MRHDELHVDEVTRFIAGAVPPRARLLEVGCGRGRVARDLAARGFTVTALDVHLHDVVEAPDVKFIERDFRAYDDAPFDAVVFTSSLHHIAPLAPAIERAHRLLRPGGLLVADEFDVAAPDAATLHWYYDMQDLLAAAGCYDAKHLDHPGDDVLARWQHAHTHHGERLHTGAEMRAAIAERFRIVDVTRRAYLYRYIWHGLPADSRGDAIANVLLASEQRRIAQGLLAPVGLRIVAQRAD